MQRGVLRAGGRYDIRRSRAVLRSHHLIISLPARAAVTRAQGAGDPSGLSSFVRRPFEIQVPERIMIISSLVGLEGIEVYDRFRTLLSALV